LQSVSERYSPASDELAVESASAGEDTEKQEEDGPYSAAPDELNVMTERIEQLIQSEQVEYEQVEYEQVESEERP
jgi:hypothetical protein